MSKYSVGVDFGTESGRALLVDVSTGQELATSVYQYEHGVIDETLPAPDEDVRLEPDWALQDPLDYIRTLQHTVPAVLVKARIDPADVIGIGIDFTARTMLPTTASGEPLCLRPEYRREPHAWVKLWKHHAAQPETDRINAAAKHSRSRRARTRVRRLWRPRPTGPRRMVAVMGTSICAASAQTPALGSAIFGTVAVGSAADGYDSVVVAAERMARLSDEHHTPDPTSRATYDELYAEYRLLHDYFGRGENDVMKRFKAIRARVIA